MHWMNQHPVDWIGHAIFFGLMAYVMNPIWAVCLCAVLLEVDQWLTWKNKGWGLKDTIIDLISDAIGILVALSIINGW